MSKCPYCGAPGGGAGSCGSCQHHLPNSSVRGAYKPPSGGGGGGGGECFPSGTPVLTVAGYVPIEHIKRGTAVITFDEAGNRVVERVVRTVSHESGTVYDVTFRGTSRVLSVTGMHPILSPGGWKRVRALGVGDLVLVVDDNGIPKVEVVQKVSAGEVRQSLHHLVVGGCNTYVANGCVAHSFVRFRRLRSCFSKMTGWLPLRRPSVSVPAHAVLS